MASRVVDNGLQRIAVQASQVTAGTPAYSATRHIQVMSWDDGTVAFAAGHTALNSGGAVTNEYDKVFDSVPTRSSQTVTHLSTIPLGSGLFTIKRIALHDDTEANVTTSSTTLVAGIDGQSLTKTADFTLAVTLSLLLTNT